MKKMSVILFILVTLGYGVVLGGPERRLAVFKKGDLFKVIYNGQSECTVRLSIVDAAGQEVFSEKVVSHGGFLRPYNFSQLPKGNYTLQVTDPSGVYQEKLSWEDSKWLAHVAKVRGSERKYMVVIPQQINQPDVAIHVYDQNQELVFTDHSNQQDGFAKIYHLKNLEGATIRLVNQSSGEEKVLVTE